MFIFKYNIKLICLILSLNYSSSVFTMEKNTEAEINNQNNIQLLDMPDEILVNIFCKVIVETAKFYMQQWNDIFQLDMTKKEIKNSLSNMFLICSRLAHLNSYIKYDISRNTTIGIDISNQLTQIKKNRFNYLSNMIKSEIKNKYSNINQNELNFNLISKINRPPITVENLKEAVKLIIAGADAYQINIHKNNVLMLAIAMGYVDLIEILLMIEKDRFQKLNLQSNIPISDIYKNEAYINNALGLAAKNNHLNVIDLLVKYGANVNFKNSKGNTILMQLLKNSKPLSARKIIKAGADVNIKSTSGKTALMFASEYGDTKTINLLIKYKAQINDKCNNNYNALYYARENKFTDVVKLLKKYTNERN